MWKSLEPKRSPEQVRDACEALRGTNSVLDFMLKHNLPLDREHYIDLAYIGCDDDLGAEEEADVPEPFRREY